jgi:hypothetical protein
VEITSTCCVSASLRITELLIKRFFLSSPCYMNRNGQIYMQVENSNTESQTDTRYRPTFHERRGCEICEKGPIWRACCIPIYECVCVCVRAHHFCNISSDQKKKLFVRLCIWRNHLHLTIAMCVT